MMRRICTADFSFPQEPLVSDQVKDLLKKVRSKLLPDSLNELG
jgi:hypothetical protein